MAQVVQQKKCREQHVSLHNPNGAVWCDNCGDYVICDWRRICQCCYTKVVKTRSFVTNIKKLDDIIEDNRIILEQYAKKPYHNNNLPGFVVQLGYRNYLISIESLAEYMTMPPTKNPDAIRPFLNKIETKSMLLMPGTKVM